MHQFDSQNPLNHKNFHNANYNLKYTYIHIQPLLIELSTKGNLVLIRELKEHTYVSSDILPIWNKGSKQPFVMKP